VSPDGQYIAAAIVPCSSDPYNGTNLIKVAKVSILHPPQEPDTWEIQQALDPDNIGPRWSPVDDNRLIYLSGGNENQAIHIVTNPVSRDPGNRLYQVISDSLPHYDASSDAGCHTGTDG